MASPDTRCGACGERTEYDEAGSCVHVSTGMVLCATSPPLSVADARTALFRWVGEGETAYTRAVDALIAAVKREAVAPVETVLKWATVLEYCRGNAADAGLHMERFMAIANKRMMEAEARMVALEDAHLAEFDKRIAAEAEVARLREQNEALVADARNFAREVRFRLEAPTENMTATDSYTWACGIADGSRRVGRTTWGATLHQQPSEGAN